MEKEEGFVMELSHDQKLVLFEFLFRYVHEDKYKVEDISEWRLLSGILANLEKGLSEPFRSDYLELLEKSRSVLRPQDLTLEDVLKS